MNIPELVERIKWRLTNEEVHELYVELKKIVDPNDVVTKHVENDIDTTNQIYKRMLNSIYGFMNFKSKIKKVIFNPPATIILWTDGTKSVVKCQNGEEFDPEKGFALAYLKKLLGNDNTFNKEIHKWVLKD